MQKLVICYTAVISGLVLVAKDLNLFKDAGLDVEFRETPTGRRALDYLQKDWVDIASLVDTNVAYLVNNKASKVKLIAVTQTKAGESVVYNPDKAIKEPKDLEGKTLSYIPKTSSHGFFHNFCKHHHIDPQLIEQEHITHEVAAKRLMQGDIDASIMWEPYSSSVILDAAQEGLTLKRFKNNDYYKMYNCLAISKKAAQKKRKEIQTCLDILNKAEEYIQTHKLGSQSIIARYMNIDPKILESFWDTLHFEVQPIGQDFIDQVKQQAGWLDNLKHENIDYEKYIDRTFRLSL